MVIITQNTMRVTLKLPLDLACDQCKVQIEKPKNKRKVVKSCHCPFHDKFSSHCELGKVQRYKKIMEYLGQNKAECKLEINGYLIELIYSQRNIHIIASYNVNKW